MKPIEQLKQTTKKIIFSASIKEEVYDWCDNFHFVFDIEITKGGTWDSGTEYAPPTFTCEDDVEIIALRVLETENYTELELSEAELNEIARELINKIEIQ